MFDLTPCFHSLETLNNFWTGGPRFSFVPGGGSYRGRPAGEEGTGRDIAHGGKVQGQERVDVWKLMGKVQDTEQLSGLGQPWRTGQIPPAPVL